MYIFAIVLTTQLGDHTAPERFMDPYWVRDDDPTGVELFGSMGDSMMTLFTRGLLCDNLAETLQAIKDRGGEWVCEGEGDDQACSRQGGSVLLAWVFIVFMIISAFCILNMLVGILCEVIEGTADAENEIANMVHLRTGIEDAFRRIDESGNHDNLITMQEWLPMKSDENVRESFMNIGVEEEFLDLRLDQLEEHLFGRIDKHKLLDPDDWLPPETFKAATPSSGKGPGIPLDDFVSAILDVRPDEPAGFLDLEILQTRVERDERTFNWKCDRIEAALLKRMSMLGQLCPGYIYQQLPEDLAQLVTMDPNSDPGPQPRHAAKIASVDSTYQAFGLLTQAQPKEGAEPMVVQPVSP